MITIEQARQILAKYERWARGDAFYQVSAVDALHDVRLLVAMIEQQTEDLWAAARQHDRR